MRLSIAMGLAFSALLVGSAAAGAPTDAVRPFYETPGLELDKSARGRFIDPARKILDQNDAIKESGGGEGCLDPALAFDDTDFDQAEVLATLNFGELVTKEEASVVATFKAEGEMHRIQWRLKEIDGAWKIFDLVSMTKDLALSQFVCE